MSDSFRERFLAQENRLGERGGCLDSTLFRVSAYYSHASETPNGSSFLPARANATDKMVDSGLSVLHDGPTWDRRRSSPLTLSANRLTHHVQLQLTLVKAVGPIEDLVQRVRPWLLPWKGAMRTDYMVIEDVSHL